jgi:hypothetical protein
VVLDDDRLQLLRAHHRTQPGAPRRVPIAGVDAGVAHDVLPGNADHQHFQVAVRVLLAQPFGSGARIETPQVSGLTNLDPVHADPQVHRPISLPPDARGLEPGGVQRRAEVPAHVRAAQRVRHRGARSEVQARGRRDGAAGQQPAAQHQHVIRAERIDVGADQFLHLPDVQATPAQVLARCHLVEGADLVLAAGEVNRQDVAQDTHLAAPDI